MKNPLGFCPQLSKALFQLGYKAFSTQEPHLCPFQGVGYGGLHMQARHLSHHNYRRGLYLSLSGLFSNVLQCAPHRGLMGGIAAGDHSRRGIRGLSCRHQPLGNLLQGGKAHKKHQRALQGCQGLNGLGKLVSQLVGVAGNHMEAPAQLPVGHRDACRRRDGNGGGNARHFLIGNPRLLQSENFLPASAEHKGVAPFQPHHILPLLCQLHQQLIGFLLGHGMAAAPLSCRVFFRFCRSLQKGMVDEVIIYHRITGFQQPQTPQGNQIPLAAACTYQIHIADFVLTHGIFPSCRNAAHSSWVSGRFFSIHKSNSRKNKAFRWGSATSRFTTGRIRAK